MSADEPRTPIYLVMGDSVTTIEGVTFIAVRPMVVNPVGTEVITTIEEPPKGRPVQRSECVDGPRPCPFISCRLHLLTERVALLDDDEVLELLDEAPETCAQDVASRGESTMREVAHVMGLPLKSVFLAEVSAKRRVFQEQVMPEFPEHPEDPYVRYTLMGEDELAGVAALLRAREKSKR